MEIRVLKYFLTVAQEQSFSKAAKVLNVSQPALSKQIKDLEEEYQITLFNRTTRSLSLTEEGRLFKEQAKQIPVCRNIFLTFPILQAFQPVH